MSAPPLVFLTGCGRSGTTILGTLVAQHPDVTFLNDRFDVWVKSFPFADVWGRRDGAGEAAIALTAADAERAGAAARGAFFERLEARREDRAVIVEKLAINNFRLPFLHALAPAAPFINIVRHGVEVARSIAERAAAGKWYGEGDRKWRALVRYADAVGLGGVAAVCRTPFERGLLEWRLSVEAAEGFFTAEPGVRVFRVRYEDLIGRAPAVARGLVEFLGLARSEAVERFAREEVGRRSAPAHESDVPASAAAIAGGALERLGYGLAAGAAR